MSFFSSHCLPSSNLVLAQLQPNPKHRCVDSSSEADVLSVDTNSYKSQSIIKCKPISNQIEKIKNPINQEKKAMDNASREERRRIVERVGSYGFDHGSNSISSPSVTTTVTFITTTIPPSHQRQIHIPSQKKEIKSFMTPIFLFLFDFVNWIMRYHRIQGSCYFDNMSCHRLYVSSIT